MFMGWAMGSDILLYAVPGFLLLILLEWWLDRRWQTGYYRLNDAFASLSLGIVSRTSQVLFFTTGLALAAGWLDGYQLNAFSMSNPWHWILAFVLFDLAYYWNHRVCHTYNIFWATHVVHHQSEEFNLTTALRQSSSKLFDWLFSVPLLLLGVPVEMLVMCLSLNLMYQFWVHTRHIGNLGWFEWLMVTPSHHRVHHGQNPQYIDKNHGGVFIIWDRLFGTFQEELDDVPVIYGVSRASNTFDPIKANVQFWGWLLKDAWRANRLVDKFVLWFRGTGWRPSDARLRDPETKPNLAHFTKYDPVVKRLVQIYAFGQLILAIPMMVFFLFSFANSAWPLQFLGFVFITAPLMTSGHLLEGKNKRREFWRLLGAFALLPFVFLFTNGAEIWVFSGHLLISVAMCALLLTERNVPGTDFPAADTP